VEPLVVGAGAAGDGDQGDGVAAGGVNAAGGGAVGEVVRVGDDDENAQWGFAHAVLCSMAGTGAYWL
jgi:hypothetical protein